jgi:hypothetical protein
MNVSLRATNARILGSVWAIFVYCICLRAKTMSRRADDSRGSWFNKPCIIPRITVDVASVTISQGQQQSPAELENEWCLPLVNDESR